MKPILTLFVVSFGLLLSGCGDRSSGEKRSEQRPEHQTASSENDGRKTEQTSERTFGQALSFLNNHTDPVVLKDGSARAVVVPEWQGRVMISSPGGTNGVPFGWVNYDFIKSDETRSGFYPYGGADRFWLGPEAGPYGLFFAPGTSFSGKHWSVPDPIDAEPYEIVKRTDTSVHVRHTAGVTNHAGTPFSVRIDRTVELTGRQTVSDWLETDVPSGVRMVAYASKNRLTNTGDRAWTREGGLLSIWILGMFRPDDTTTLVIPYRSGGVTSPDEVVNDAYFHPVPDDRLTVTEETVFFKGDGQYRSKIGVPPDFARDLFGSYSVKKNVLTLIHYSKPEGVRSYVNSLWEKQKYPFRGDAINSYNDGPPDGGGEPLGPFYELESSSPALDLTPGASHTHHHRTMHFTGSREALDRLSRSVLGVSLGEIEGAF